MVGTIEAPVGFEIYPGSATAAMVGDDDEFTQRVAGVLSRHRYNVVHHDSPRDVIDGLVRRQEIASPPPHEGRPRPRAESTPRPVRAAKRESPRLYIFNCRAPAPGTSLREWGADWINALKELSKRAPGTAVVVAVGPEPARNLIKAAIQAGADEILSAGDVEIDELVWVRVQSALAKANAAPEAASVVLRASTRGQLPPEGERRRGERRGSGPVTESSAGSPEGDVVESWDEPATPAQIQAARERVRAALGGIPTAEERGRPLAELLGVSVPALRAGSGRLDAKKIADHLGVPLARLSRIVPISRQALNETPDSVRVQGALDPLARILHVLGTVLPPEHVRAWLNAPHALLGGEAPIHAILDGRAEQVARMLEAARDGGVD
jgi:hypothetical protein